MGLGFLSLVLGVLGFSSLAMRVGGWTSSGVPGWLVVLLGLVLLRLWVLFLLPALAYAAARVFDLRPWSTAVGGAATGEVFLLALDAITPGWAALLEAPGLLAVRVATFAGGVGLTALAVKRGRAAALAVEQVALEAARARKAEYDAFLRASEETAERAASGERSSNA